MIFFGACLNHFLLFGVSKVYFNWCKLAVSSPFESQLIWYVISTNIGFIIFRLGFLQDIFEYIFLFWLLLNLYGRAWFNTLILLLYFFLSSSFWLLNFQLKFVVNLYWYVRRNQFAMKLINGTFAGIWLSLLWIIVFIAILQVLVFMGICLGYLYIISPISWLLRLWRVNVYLHVLSTKWISFLSVVCWLCWRLNFILSNE